MENAVAFVRASGARDPSFGVMVLLAKARGGVR